MSGRQGTEAAANDWSMTACVITGSIFRIDRLPSGGIEVIDDKTGRVSARMSRSANAERCSLRAFA